MAKYCRYCGSSVREGANFCKTCGRSLAKTGGSVKLFPAVVPTPPTYTPAAPESPHVTEKRKRPGAVVFVIPIMLAIFASAAFLWPGFFRDHIERLLNDPLQKALAELTDEELTPPEEAKNGVSFIYFDPDSVQPMTASVNSENRRVSFANGVQVSFGNNCLTEETRQLEVRSLGKQFDGTYEAVGYDFLLDGEEAEFDGLVEITLPLDQGLGENVFVQYYNKKNGAWEILFAESNGNGGITFKTEHFCTFGEFYNMVLSGGGDANGKILTMSDPFHDGLRLQATVHWDVLAAQLREGKLSPDEKLSKLTDLNNEAYVNRMLTNWGNTTTGLDYLSKALKIPGISKVLGPVGQTLTLAKFFYQAKRDGWQRAFNANNTDLAMLTIGAGAALPGPAGWAYSAVSLGYYLYSATTDTLTNISLNGSGTVEDYAYRKFSSKFIEYNRNAGQITIWRFTHPGGIDKRSGIVMLPIGGGDKDKENWRLVLEDAVMRENRGEMKASEYLDRIINGYVDAFWSLNSSYLNLFLDANTKPGLLWGEERLSEIYKAPNGRTKDNYRKRLKSDLYAWLKPEIEPILEKEYTQLLNSVFDSFLHLEQMLNESYRIDLVDPRVEYFADSEFRGHPIGLGTSTEDAPVTINQWNYGRTGHIEFTNAGWLEMNCPKWLRILGTKTDPWSFKENYYVKLLNLRPGQNSVVIDRSDPTPTPELTATPEPTAVLSLDSFAGYWKQINGAGMTVTIGKCADGGVAYGETDGKASMGYRADRWSRTPVNGYLGSDERALTLYSEGFLGGYIECGLVGDDYLIIRNGNGERYTYNRTNKGYDVSHVDKYFSDLGLPSGKTMGVGTTVNSLTLGGSE